LSLALISSDKPYGSIIDVTFLSLSSWNKNLKIALVAIFCYPLDIPEPGGVQRIGGFRMKYKATRRELMEFPWLWGIRHGWYRRQTPVIIRNMPQSWKKKNLYQPSTPNGKILGKYVFATNEVDVEMLLPIDLTLRIRLHSHGLSVTSVQYITIWEETQERFQKITIYRPPKNERSFSKIL
jgi:hypothetical protein